MRGAIFELNHKSLNMSNEVILTAHTKEQIINEIVKAVINGIDDRIKTYSTPKATEQLTRKEAAKLCKVSLVTLDNWTKEGVLQSYRLGRNTIRYKQSEVIEALQAIHKRRS